MRETAMTSNSFPALVASAFSAGVIKKIVFSKARYEDIERATGRTVSLRRGRALAVEYRISGDTVRHINVPEDGILDFTAGACTDFGQINLITTLGDAERRVSKKGVVTVTGDRALREKLGGGGNFETAIEEIDRRKDYILRGDEEFLIKLGISDGNGRVHDKRQGKFRQINRFLEQVRDIYTELPREGEILIYDLCCGKSYLSFAIYYYLTAICGREVRMLGVDLKADVIDYCARCAAECGFSGMSFVCKDVRDTPEGEVPDMVISLHACDIATDIVLSRAAELGSPVILSTPCCQRYMKDKITSPELSFITRFPHIANKLCEAVTDSLRLMYLRSRGYDVCARELTDPDDTPKNTLLRAVKRTDGDARALAEYRAALKFITGDENFKVDF